MTRRIGVHVGSLMLGMVGLSIGSGEAVVDVGCGVGRLTRALAARAGHVYGLDVSREMLALAEEHNPDLTKSSASSATSGSSPVNA